jgi:hypothetical protein
MVRQLVASVSLAACLVTTTVNAQDGMSADASRRRLNVTVSTGMLSLKAVDDNRSGALWEFRSSRQHRVSIDRNVSENMALGLTVGYAPLSLWYRRVRFAGEGPGGCNSGCDATADLWSIGATVRAVSGPGLHHIVELTAGVSQYSDFREVVTGSRLSPRSADRDASVLVGYGVGWKVARLLELAVMGDAGFAVHGRSGTDFPKTDVTWLGQFRAMLRSGF